MGERGIPYHDEDDFAGLPEADSIEATDGQTAKTGELFNTATEQGRRIQDNYENALRSLPVYQFSDEEMKKIFQKAKDTVDAENRANGNNN